MRILLSILFKALQKSIPKQDSKTPNSQVYLSESSSAFEVLASEEVTSQVITYQEEVVNQSQASQQGVGEDLAGCDILFLQKRFWIIKLMLLLKTLLKLRLMPIPQKQILTPCLALQPVVHHVGPDPF